MVTSFNGESSRQSDQFVSATSQLPQYHSEIGSGNKSPNHLDQETMASKVCPVCKIFKSSSNTTLNAHIDQCLSRESTMKGTSNPKVIKNEVKPRKKRLLVDIYKTAPLCTLEDLDRRNGTNGAPNSTSPTQGTESHGKELEKEQRLVLNDNVMETDHVDDVYIDSNGTKLRILSPPKIGAGDHGSQKLLKRRGFEKGSNQEEKLSIEGEQRVQPYEELELGDNQGTSKRRACSSKRGQTKSARYNMTRNFSVERDLKSVGNKSFSRVSSSSDTPISSPENSKNMTASPYEPIPIPGPPGSFLPSPGADIVSEDIQGSSSLTNIRVQSSEDPLYLVDRCSMLDSPISATSTISNPTFPRSRSRSLEKLSVRSTAAEERVTPSEQNDHQTCCSREEGVVKSLASNYQESSLLRRPAMEWNKCSDNSLSLEPQTLTLSNYPIEKTSVPNTTTGNTASVNPPSSTPVIRLMGKDLVVVNNLNNERPADR